MRLTWVVLGVVLAAGTIAFVYGEQTEPDTKPAATSPGGAAPGDAAPGDRERPALNKPATRDAPADPLDIPLAGEDEAREGKAKAIIAKLKAASAKGDGPGADKLFEQLRREAWDAPSARRLALRRGIQQLRATPRSRGTARVEHLDGVRRLLSRGVYLPEMFQENGASTEQRTKLMARIQQINRMVMTHAPGVEGVTVPYEVESGISPVQIVSRKKLPMGSNALLFWNQGGNLDPTKLTAGARLLLPQEELTLVVHINLRRLGVFVGDWFVKEFRVGVGKDDSPTPTGRFQVDRRQQNPDWWTRIDGRKVRIPFGHPKNELGSMWISIFSDEIPVTASYGIHGTIKPETVGTACSNGCVRLENNQARELYDWVRTGSAGGKATRIHIRY